MQAARLHSRDESFDSSFRRLQVERPRNESNAFVVEGEKMLQRFLNALAVIDDYVRGARAVRPGVHEHHWNIAAR